MPAAWAEMNVVLADEFRDGNVPAMMGPPAVAKKSFAALPETVKTYYCRGDSASHESNPINWLRDGERADGPQGFIGFAISARMSEALRKAVESVPEEAWEAYGKAHATPDPGKRGGEFRAWGEVRTQRHATAALHRDPDPAAARGSVCRRRKGEAFRGGDQHWGSGRRGRLKGCMTYGRTSWRRG